VRQICMLNPSLKGFRICQLEFGINEIARTSAPSHEVYSSPLLLLISCGEVETCMRAKITRSRIPEITKTAAELGHLHLLQNFLSGGGHSRFFLKRMQFCSHTFRKNECV
jgi:hypothetical protein